MKPLLLILLLLPALRLAAQVPDGKVPTGYFNAINLTSSTEPMHMEVSGHQVGRERGLKSGEASGVLGLPEKEYPCKVEAGTLQPLKFPLTLRGDDETLCAIFTHRKLDPKTQRWILELHHLELAGKANAAKLSVVSLLPDIPEMDLRIDIIQVKAIAGKAVPVPEWVPHSTGIYFQEKELGRYDLNGEEKKPLRFFLFVYRDQSFLLKTYLTALDIIGP